MIGKHAGIGALVLWLAVCFCICNAEPSQAAVITRMARWDVAQEPGRRGVRIISSAEYCRGDPRPYVSHVEKKERKDGTYITVFVRSERKTRVCLGVGVPVYGFIRLSKSAVELPLYDSSTSPPSRRWHSDYLFGGLNKLARWWREGVADLLGVLGASKRAERLGS
jgi:hypothetical protein